MLKWMKVINYSGKKFFLSGINRIKTQDNLQKCLCICKEITNFPTSNNNPDFIQN